MTNAFIVDSPDELLALQRVFREAKFSTEPDDIEVSDSPIVAGLFERLMAVLINHEVARDGEAARQRWIEWLTIDESRDEWLAAVRRAKADARWSLFADGERLTYIKVLLSPFTLTPELIQKFVFAVNS